MIFFFLVILFFLRTVYVVGHILCGRDKKHEGLAFGLFLGHVFLFFFFIFMLELPNDDNDENMAMTAGHLQTKHIPAGPVP